MLQIASPWLIVEPTQLAFLITSLLTGFNAAASILLCVIVKDFLVNDFLVTVLMFVFFKVYIRVSFV